MNKVTVKDVMSWNPCDTYTLERVTALFGGRGSVTALDVLDMDIPVQDSLWAVLRPEMIPEPLLHELACRFAESTLHIWELWAKENRPDLFDVPRRAIETKRAWLRGEATDEVLSAARVASRDSAWAAVQTSSSVSAMNAAWAAARAASVSAWHAARAAAWAEAGHAQIDLVRQALQEGKP